MKKQRERQRQTERQKNRKKRERQTDRDQKYIRFKMEGSANCVHLSGSNPSNLMFALATSIY